jgi:hypothetical protein
MSDLGTVSILVDVRGQPVVRELAKDLNNVAAAEAKVSAATQKVMADYRRTRDVMAMLKKTTEDTSASFQRFSVRDLQQASQRMQGFESSLANTRRGMGQMGMATQQVGYQVGDFLVQIQSGTNPLVAFGQQATQLVGILPAFSGVLGMSVGSLIALSSGLGIAIPLLTAIGAVFMRTSEESEKATSAVDRQKEAYDALVESITRLRIEQDMLRSGAETTEEQTALNEIKILEAERASLLVQSAELAARMNEEGATSLGIEVERINLALQTNEIERKKLENVLRLSEEERNRLSDLEAQERLLQTAYELYGRTRLEAQGLASATLAAVDALAAMNMEFSVAGRQLAQYGGRGTVSDTAVTDQYGNVVDTLRSKRPKSRPIDIDFGVPDVPTQRGGRRTSQLRKEVELTKELTQAEKDRQTILQSIEGSLESGFMSMVDGTKSVKDAFRSMAADIIKELYRVLVVQRLVGAISGGIGVFSGPSTGSLGLPFGLATGGSVMPGKSYLVGENGPELVIPRHSGTVVNANQTANAAGGSGGFTQNLTISVSGSDASMVRAEVAKMIPQITNATKAAVIDARLRGGQMKAAFS